MSLILWLFVINVFHVITKSSIVGLSQVINSIALSSITVRWFKAVEVLATTEVPCPDWRTGRGWRRPGGLDQVPPCGGPYGGGDSIGLVVMVETVVK